MYNLIIVDDEYTIRKGLKQYIPWQSLGFEVAGVFEDGPSALSFLSSNHVNVVLTDIDMPIMNGIQLIEAVRKNNYADYCLVISGYQDFNYAHQLIPLHITDYILKPISNELVQKTFLKLKQELDKTAEKEKQLSKEHARMQLMKNTLLQQYLSDMVLEKISYTQALKRIEVLDLGIDITHTHIICSELIITNLKELLQKSWHYGIDALYDSIINYLKNSTRQQLYEIIKSQNTICLIYIDTTDIPLSSIISSFEADLKKACHSIQEISSIALSVQSVCNYKSYMENHSYNADNKSLNYFYVSINSALLEQNFTAVNEDLDTLLSKTSSLPLNKARTVYEKLFDILSNQCSDNKEIISAAKTRLHQYNNIKQYHSILLDCVKKIQETVVLDANHQIDMLMDQALAYIDVNYQKDISRNDVANYVFLSASYFSRCFKRRTNMKFIDYLTKVRIQKACELLLNPDNKINDVCFAVGYNSASYFTRVFKYIMGTTPNDYIRKNILNKELK